MTEIARTQRSAGASGQLFDAMAVVYSRFAKTPMGRRTPESVTGVR